ncbi:MAG: ATP-binding cassette domain-containing protein [Rickettsiales bacterium]|jgi:subfamily B ATP-binding cassette protein MsbA|nr:ATP-binding cassette domain-containing protein [Rickettsiales bacterium]
MSKEKKEKFSLTKQNAQILKRLWDFAIKRYFKYVLYAVVFMGMSAGAEAYTYSFLQPLFDEGFLSQNFHVINLIALQVVGVYFVKNVALFAHEYIMGLAGLRITKEVQLRMFSHFMKMSVNFFHKKSTGALLTNYSQDTQSVNRVLQNFFTDFLKELLTILCMFVLMIYQSWQMSLIILVVLPAVAIPLSAFGKRIRKLFGKTMTQTEIMTSYLSQLFKSVPIVKIYNKEKAEKEKATGIVEYMYDLGKKDLKIRAINRPLLEMIGGFAIAGALILGGWQISLGILTPGQFATFLTALFACYRPLKGLSRIIVEMQRSVKNAERMFEIFDEKPEINDKKNAKDLKPKSGDIEFKDVSFYYENGDWVLKDVNLKIKSGQNVALVGPSGGGKSTILKLIPRFYDTQKGNVIIYGDDVKDVTQHSLHDKMALVSQDVVLFDDTVYNNIAYGASRKVTKEEIYEAAQLAYADEFIKKLPNGYETKIGENGIKLSGGQKQRLSIARAIIKNAPILLLDEATSALDTESEKLIQKSLDNLMKSKTSITIAHRLSTITNSDVIFVVENGKIVEHGSHNVLLKKKGAYYNLYNLQFKKQEKKAKPKKK